MTTATTLAFPLHRRRTLIVTVARQMEIRHGEDANLYWRATAKDLLYELALTGMATEAAKDEVRSFLYAVIAEMSGPALEVTA